MLDYARHALTSRTHGALYADAPIPAGANVTGDWEPDTGGWSRGLNWGAFGEERISVDLDGLQQHDGSHTRQINRVRAGARGRGRAGGGHRAATGRTPTRRRRPPLPAKRIGRAPHYRETGRPFSS
jgi:hypothetical protein